MKRFFRLRTVQWLAVLPLLLTLIQLALVRTQSKAETSFHPMGQYIPGDPLPLRIPERIPLGTRKTMDSPPNPAADLEWSAEFLAVADIQKAFNDARVNENAQLGLSMPALVLPAQNDWSAMTDGEKALWLINRERVDRGLEPFDGLETNVQDVAQQYAQFLLDNDKWGHEEDGRTPWERLSDNPVIGGCHDFLGVAENLAVFVTSGSSIPLKVERALYNWMYNDGGCCAWGHRRALLWYPFDDNSCKPGQEGYMGIGRVNGGPYQGSFSSPWNHAEIVVYNVFDPCGQWECPVDVGLADVITGLRVLSRLSASSEELQRADLDKNGLVDFTDILLALRALAETSIP